MSAADASQRYMVILLAVYIVAWLGRSLMAFFTGFTAQLVIALLTEAAASPQVRGRGPGRVLCPLARRQRKLHQPLTGLLPLLRAGVSTLQGTLVDAAVSASATDVSGGACSACVGDWGGCAGSCLPHRQRLTHCRPPLHHHSMLFPNSRMAATGASACGPAWAGAA